MAAYMIVAAKVADRDAFLSGYGRAAAALVERYGGRYLLRAPGGVALEGDWGDGCSLVISEWPDMAALRRFWNSEDYKAARRLRDGVADVRVWAIEAPRIEA